MPIVIQLPRLRSLVGVSVLLLGLCAFAYWFKEVRPYFHLSHACLNAYSTEIGSDALGRIAQLGPQEGDLVKKGDLLFAFDRELLVAKQMQLKASLETLHQQANLEKERMAKAMDGYLAMGPESDDAIHRQLRMMEESQTKAEEIAAQMQSLQTELELKELELKKGAFFAPFEGVILKRYKNEGAVIHFGDPVYSLCDPKRLWVEAQVPETQIGAIALGTVAKVRLAAYPNKEWIGKVSYISPAASGTPAMIPIKISFETYDPLLKPGLFAKVDLKVH